MAAKRIIKIIAFIELLIGLSTVFGLTTYTVLSLSTKPLNVFIFVLLCAVISSMIGAGLFDRREWARVLLVFFSGYVIITKAMVFAGLLQFNGEIMTFIPAGLKNCASVLYHGFVLIFFTRKSVKGRFASR